MDRYPSIPESQLAALYQLMFGELQSNLDTFFWFGLFINLLFIAFASFWGAIISLRIQIPVYVLFCSALLIASQPGMIFTWTSYYHYMVLLLPCGLAVCWLCQNSMKISLSLQTLFFVLGFALTIQYLAAIPLVSLAIAFTATLLQSSKNKIYTDFSKIYCTSLLGLISTSAVAVFIMGFLAIFLEIPAKLAVLIKSEYQIMAVLFLIVFGALCIATIFAAKRNISKFFKTGISNFFFSTVGISFIGWFVGANLLVFTAWHRGIYASLRWRDQINSSWSIDQFSHFIVGTRLWLWVIPLILLIALAMLSLSLGKKKYNQMNGLFASIFILSVIGINIYLMPQLAESMTTDSAAMYAIPRHLASVVITIPVALYWCWIKSKKLGYYAGVVATIISFLSLADYQLNMAPMGSKNIETQKYLDSEVRRFREANTNGRVICYNSHMYRQCMLDSAYKYYIPVYISNSKNPTLPVDFGDLNNRAISQSDINCKTLEKCLSVPHDRNYPILLIAENQIIPKAITVAGRRIESGIPNPQNLIILEIQ